MEILFTTVKEMVNWLIDNEGKIIGDSYGREWKYEDFKFFFKDVGGEFEKEVVSCLHLHRTNMYILN